MWLVEELADMDAARAAKPFLAERMRAYPVDRRVGNPKNDDAGLLEPVVRVLSQ
jgi:hypothetical protein